MGVRRHKGVIDTFDKAALSPCTILQVADLNELMLSICRPLLTQPTLLSLRVLPPLPLFPPAFLDGQTGPSTLSVPVILDVQLTLDPPDVRFH
jgi:hypothetical protein